MLFVSILYLLLSNAVTFRRDKSILYNRTSMSVSLIIFIILYRSLYLKFISKGISLYGGLFHTTTVNHTFQLFILLISMAILQLTSFYPRKVYISEYTSLINLIYNKFIYYNTKIINKMTEQYKIIEYSMILLFIVVGAIFLMSSADIVSIFISIELQSYGLYLLCTLYRNSESSTSAGLTYFLLGGLSSCFILLGLSLLYTNSGITSLENFYVITSLSNTNNVYNNLFSWYETNYISLSLVIMSVGFLFKISAAPFHFWSPDVYDAIPTIVTTFVAILAKISILVFLSGIVYYTGDDYGSSNFNWITCLLVSSLLSLIIGTILGLNQSRIKRLYAYSTISHVGFILLALSTNTLESIQAFIFYLMQYSISNLNAFFLLIAIGYSLYTYVNIKEEKIADENLIDKNNSPIQFISQVKGYFHNNPILALSLGITIYSFVGIPPLIGFFAKQMVLSAALDNGYIFLVLVAILTSVISAVYYLSIINQVFFENTRYKIKESFNSIKFKGYIKSRDLLKKVEFKADNIVLSNTFSITISLLTLVILLFILNPQELLSLTNILSLLTFNI